jgi:peptide/nickel transport system substrate-binding protein
MIFYQNIFTFLILALLIASTFGCRARAGGAVTLALDAKFSTLDPIGGATVDANAERLRNLMFNSLIKKNDKFEYVGELAKEIKDVENGISFTLQDGVKFHDGRALTSKDAKYTLDELLKSQGAKAAAFFVTEDKEKKPRITAVEAPDEKTLILKFNTELKTLRPAAIKNDTLSNLVAIPIIPEGTFAIQKDAPIGSGPFKFVKFDSASNVVDLAAFDGYWEGAPTIKDLRVKTVADANALQAELQSGQVDVAAGTINLSPDTIKSLGANPTLKVEQFPGANIQYLGFNTQSKPFDNAKVRQAIAYAIDREKIIRDLLAGQAAIAHSILPEQSWAYAASTKYTYDPAKARLLLQEAGYKGEPIKFKISSGNAAVSQYSQVIQNELKEVGISAEIETAEFNVLLSDLQKGQYQMTTARWVGGNQDPIFLRDLFASSEIPDEKRASRNRSRFSNPDFDKAVTAAINEPDRAKAAELYKKAQQIVSDQAPMIPLWYPANMVITNKRIGNIQINGSGDWTFVRNLTVTN